MIYLYKTHADVIMVTALILGTVLGNDDGDRTDGGDLHSGTLSQLSLHMHHKNEDCHNCIKDDRNSMWS